MIGYLEGNIKSIQNDDNIIINVSGVGWSVFTPNTGSLSEGQAVALYIHTSVREDDISLWGFSSQDELSLFKLLLSVSGIGAKTALNMIKILGYNAIVSSINKNDPIALKVKGIGIKTSEKVILELKDKVKLFSSSELDKFDFKDEKIQNAKDALIALGYKESDISRSMSKLANLDIGQASEQDLIKLLLAKL